MEKIPIEKQKYLTKHAIKSHIHKLKRSWKERNMNLLFEKLTHEDILKRSWKVVIPPLNFDFINNTDEIIKYFNSYIKYIKNHSIINYDLGLVENLTFDAITILLSQIKQEKYWKYYKKWYPPKKPKLKKLFANSWFYQFVRTNSEISNDESKSLMIKTEFEKNVDLEKVAGVLDNFDKKLNNEEFIYLNNMISECMENTKNHAWDDYNWWLFYYNDEEKWIKYLCFLDLWIWIFWSLNSKIEKFSSLAWVDSNCKRLELLLKNEAKKSTSTWEWKRWNWLPSIYKFSQLEKIKNFTIITNDVNANIDKWKYIKLNNQFEWTFYYMEI